MNILESKGQKMHDGNMKFKFENLPLQEEIELWLGVITVDG